MSDDIQILEGDRQRPRLAEPHPIIFVLDHLRSAYNVGNIYRLAEIFRIQAIITCGYTATPPHPKLQKTARGCERLVPSEHFATALEAVRELKRRGYHILAVETVANATPLWASSFTFPLAIVLDRAVEAWYRQTTPPGNLQS
ncbi:MAG: hypothetical protein D6820_06230 [Lentisphaerae bacterium]|nr:MAG: hypothetical protein D6820_06230 [Lentisphaerota bacterium]